MNRLRTAAFGVALSLAGSACSAPESHPRPEVPTESVLTAQRLMMKGAGIRIIHVPTAKFVPDRVPELEIMEARRALLEHKPELLDRIRQAAIMATKGYYVPNSVSFVSTPPIATDAVCISNDNPLRDDPFQQEANNLVDDDAINVLFIDLPSCHSDENLSGYNPKEGLIVITRRGAYSLPRNLLHELGHLAGEKHAGLMVCGNPAQIKKCVTYPVGDRNSIMGYSDQPGAYDFTAPELDRLGLLPESEALIDPGPGNYPIGDVSDERSTIKLISFDTPDGRVYLSWENEQQRTTNPNSQPFANNSLQVRVKTLDGVEIIAREAIKDSPNTLKTYPVVGETKPNTILYEGKHRDNKILITFVGRNERDQGVVKIEIIK